MQDQDRYVDWKRLNQILVPTPRRVKASVSRLELGYDFRVVARLARAERDHTMSALKDLGQGLSARYNNESSFPPLAVYAGGRRASVRLSTVRGNIFAEMLKDAYPGVFCVSLTTLENCLDGLNHFHPGRRNAYKKIRGTARQISIPDVSRLIPVTRHTMPPSPVPHRQYGPLEGRPVPTWRPPDFPG